MSSPTKSNRNLHRMVYLLKSPKYLEDLVLNITNDNQNIFSTTHSNKLKSIGIKLLEDKLDARKNHKPEKLSLSHCTQQFKTIMINKVYGKETIDRT